MSVSKLAQELEDMPPDEPFDWIAFSARVNENSVLRPRPRSAANCSPLGRSPWNL